MHLFQLGAHYSRYMDNLGKACASNVRLFQIRQVGLLLFFLQDNAILHFQILKYCPKMLHSILAGKHEERSLMLHHLSILEATVLQRQVTSLCKPNWIIFQVSVKIQVSAGYLTFGVEESKLLLLFSIMNAVQCYSKFSNLPNCVSKRAEVSCCVQVIT